MSEAGGRDDTFEPRGRFPESVHAFFPFLFARASDVPVAVRGILERFGGAAARTAEGLATLPGAGRGTADRSSAGAFGLPVVAADARPRRISWRPGPGPAGFAVRAGRDPAAAYTESRRSPFRSDGIGRALRLSRNPLRGECPPEFRGRPGKGGARAGKAAGGAGLPEHLAAASAGPGGRKPCRALSMEVAR
jgi:hypothetical protein